MRHFAAPSFWACYRTLPSSVRDLADKNYELLKSNPAHPSLHFKKVGKYRAVRVGLQYRALAVEAGDDLLWFWIGSHSEYDKLIGARRCVLLTDHRRVDQVTAASLREFA